MRLSSLAVLCAILLAAGCADQPKHSRHELGTASLLALGQDRPGYLFAGPIEDTALAGIDHYTPVVIISSPRGKISALQTDSRWMRQPVEVATDDCVSACAWLAVSSPNACVQPHVKELTFHVAVIGLRGDLLAGAGSYHPPATRELLQRVEPAFRDWLTPRLLQSLEEEEPDEKGFLPVSMSVIEDHYPDIRCQP